MNYNYNNSHNDFSNSDYSNDDNNGCENFFKLYKSVIVQINFILSNTKVRKLFTIYNYPKKQ